MAKKFGVKKWLLPACVALVERQGPITYAEAEKLGLGMTVMVTEAREKYIQQPRGKPRKQRTFDSSSDEDSEPEPPIENTTQLVKAVLGIK